MHEQQSRYRIAIENLEKQVTIITFSEHIRFSKQLKKLQEQQEEIRIYEEIIHHLADQIIKIDLDDGIKLNYEKFQNVLAKIK